MTLGDLDPAELASARTFPAEPPASALRAVNGGRLAGVSGMA
jgi:hypothetical protein